MDLTSSVAMVERWIAIVTPFINKVVVVILILLIGFIAGKLIGRLFLWALRSLKTDESLKRLLRVQWPFARAVSQILALTVYVVTVFLVLRTLGIVEVVIGIILAVAIILVATSLLVGIKDFFPNAIAGFSIRGHLRRGDSLETEHVKGSVRKVGFLHTEVVLKNGDVVLVPHIAVKTKGRVKKKMPQHGGRG